MSEPKRAIIRKMSEAHLRVDTDRATEMDIKDFFTYKAAGYRFHPKYKAGLWNGDISLYNSRTRVLPSGLKSHLYGLFEKLNIRVELMENPKFTEIDDENQITLDEVEQFMYDLDITLPNGAKPREYQIEAVYEAIKAKRISLKSPTSSGKSMILYAIIRWILDQNPHAKIMLMVPTVALVNQMLSDFREYSEKNGWDVDRHMHGLFSGQAKDLSKSILVTTWQSLSSIAKDPNRGAKVFAIYNAVLVDECHTAKAKEIQSILEYCTNASYRIGTTGTFDDTKVHELMIVGLLGPIYTVITTKELMESGQVSDLKIKAIVLKYPEWVRKAAKKTKNQKKMDYPTEFKFVSELEHRNQFIVNLCNRAEGASLILCIRKETQAKVIYEMLKETSTKPTYYVSGDVSPADKETIRKLANKSDCNIVATLQTMSTGVSIPNIRNVVFASPFKSSIKVLQSIGRGLRLFNGKTGMKLFDIIDDFSSGTGVNFSYDHGTKRLEIYRNEEFDVTVTEVPFNVPDPGDGRGILE